MTVVRLAVVSGGPRTARALAPTHLAYDAEREGKMRPEVQAERARIRALVTPRAEAAPTRAPRLSREAQPIPLDAGCIHSPGVGLEVPAVLVSFYYLDQWESTRRHLCYRDWIMDSGAFSAHNSGKPIDLGEYIETCQHLLAVDPTLTEVFALDVIGDWRAGLRNTEAMWRAGVPAIPTFHVGEPEEALLELAGAFPKIALGGAVRYKHRNAWAEQCFHRIWPKRVHGLGFGEEKVLLRLPFESVDCSSWELLPTSFGTWKSFGQLSVRSGQRQNLRPEVTWHLALEQRVQARWPREMATLRALAEAPTSRLPLPPRPTVSPRAPLALASSTTLP